MSHSAAIRTADSLRADARIGKKKKIFTDTGRKRRTDVSSRVQRERKTMRELEKKEIQSQLHNTNTSRVGESVCVGMSDICCPFVRSICSAGNSTTEPYIVGTISVSHFSLPLCSLCVSLCLFSVALCLFIYLSRLVSRP